MELFNGIVREKRTIKRKQFAEEEGYDIKPKIFKTDNTSNIRDIKNEKLSKSEKSCKAEKSSNAEKKATKHGRKSFPNGDSSMPNGDMGHDISNGRTKKNDENQWNEKNESPKTANRRNSKSNIEANERGQKTEKTPKNEKPKLGKASKIDKNPKETPKGRASNVEKILQKDTEKSTQKTQKTTKAEKTPIHEEPVEMENTPKSKRKAEKTTKLEKTPTYDKNSKAEKTPKADKSPRVEKKAKPEKTPDSEKTPKADKNPRAEKTPKTEKPPKAEKTPQEEKTPRAQKTPKTEKAQDKTSRAEKEAEAEKVKGEKAVLSNKRPKIEKTPSDKTPKPGPKSSQNSSSKSPKVDKIHDNSKECKVTKTATKSAKEESVLKASTKCNQQPEKKLCQKSTCPNSSMVCFSQAGKNCVVDGHSPRWFHMSNEEHFCNACFEYFYRPHKPGYAQYEEWKSVWSIACRKEAALKVFLSEEILPFWVQCVDCEKWRELSHVVVLDREMASSFCCSDVMGLDCKVAEHPIINEAKDFSWLPAATCLPLLKDSPAAPFLTEFYYDGIGHSPPTPNCKESSDKFAENMVPFYSAEDSEKARCICADVMTDEEKQFFPYFVKYSLLYLALRNLLISMWNINPKQYLTYKNSSTQLIARGLCRVTLAEELKKVLDFLTLNGSINFGILPKVPRYFNFDYWRGSVLIIGAGIAGVGAARQLKNAGCTVKVLEASDRCGGRIKDDHSLGSCVGLGAQMITGCINNPLYVMCNQADIALQSLDMQRDLIDDSGNAVDMAIDEEVEFRFNLMLDSLEDWKQSINKHKHESFSLSEALTEQLKELQKSLCKNMSQVEQDLLQFHLGNLEYGCGSSLQNVSAVHWNQNEEFPQYSGNHAWTVDGFESIVHELADDIDIVYNRLVTSINSTGKKIKVKTKCGNTFTADKVICALPLSVFQSKLINFNPSLPERKQAAIDRLGSGLIEKIALKFPKPFWRKKIGKADYFGHIPSSVKERGLFSVFYDVSKGNNYVLMTVVAGEALKIKSELTDDELIRRCMKTLRNIFKNDKVPAPSAYIVSHWASDVNTRMAYSFVKVGSSGEDCDIISESMDGKVFFAGEHTNRQFPQTVTGAYLSGLREAKKILQLDT